mmetsp:Transcript_5301/g.11196  ORF Transcript_5301/g.11196 Transcript_5301/m.11196 type:complete len:282 (+) Transcript_5301:136-981(+)
MEQHTHLSDGIDGIRASPRPSIEGPVHHQLVRIAQLRPGTRRTGPVPEVEQEQRQHRRLGGVRLRNLVRPERGHALIGPREHAGAYHGRGGGGGGHVGRDGAALPLPCHDGAPVLQALGERVVGPLLHRQAVDEVQRRAVVRPDGGAGVFLEVLPPAEELGGGEEELFGGGGRRLVVGLRGGARGGGDEVAVGGGAEVDEGRVRAALGERLADGVHRQADLDVQRPVEVGVAPHHEVFSRVQVQQPVLDEGRVRKEIAAGGRVELCVVGAVRLWGGEGKGD